MSAEQLGETQDLDLAGYAQQLKPSRCEQELLDSLEVSQWFYEHKHIVEVLAAPKVRGIHAKNYYPADSMLENLIIQDHVVETAWRWGIRTLLFLGSSCIYPKYA